MAAPDSIYQLVEKFEQGHDYYKSAQYNETQVRVEFINPLFGALGWDVNDSQHVIHEAMVYVEENARMKPKHPDYAFLRSPRISGSGSPDYGFFVEAKAPHVDLRGGISPAYQVRRYGWSAKLPASVLTDFEELSLYDCRVRPNKDDNPRKDRLLYFTFRDYVENWDDLAGLLSYEAVRDNQLDEFVRGKGERGTSTVDEAFLRDLESWRVLLAKHIALHNPGLTRREINMTVQLTIDRIVFLRICEDRGIEAYGRLRDLGSSPAIYAELTQFFRQADARYNSGLFHFSDEAGRGDRDDLTLGLTIPNEPLSSMLSGLYYPTSPYEFSVLPADILGQVYERFLGSVIELSSGGQAEVVEKPEVRKAGGVYYTPTYIVEYIVANTVGKLLEGKTPEEAAELRILDPACGSGSFLIGAYQFMMDWHLAHYSENNPRRHVREGRLRELDPVGEGEPGAEMGSREKLYALTTEEKKRILLNNIYGVDLDQQAVEVSKLSLLLKMLEGENAASVSGQQQLFGERILPDLGANIKWGNSLIGPDFYAGKQLGLFEDEELYKVKVFDWNDPQHGFGQIMRRGGFDAVIGNPPYIRIQTMKDTAPESVEYYSQRYRSAKKGNYDIYVVFVERGLELLNAHGRLGYILPHKFFNAQYGEPLRGLIAEGKHLSHVVHFGSEQVFSGATTYTCILALTKSINESISYHEVSNLNYWSLSKNGVDKSVIQYSKVTSNDWNFVVGASANLFDKLQASPFKLRTVASRIAQGIRTSGNQVYVLEMVSEDDNLIKAYSKQLDRDVVLDKHSVSYFLKGREIKPYRIIDSGQVVIIPYSIEGGHVSFIPENEYKRRFPNTYEYLQENRSFLEERERGRMRHKEWYAYIYPKNIDVMVGKKILVPDIADSASYALDDQGKYAFTSGYAITLNEHVKEHQRYILGLLNSKVLDFFLKQISTTIRGGYFRYFTQYLEQLPIRTINFEDAADVARHDRMVALVERMLDLHKQLPALSGQAEKVVRAQIAATDREIDALVYALYGLTDEEIRVVEGEGAPG